MRTSQHNSPSRIHAHFSAGYNRKYQMSFDDFSGINPDYIAELKDLGIGIDSDILDEMANSKYYRSAIAKLTADDRSELTKKSLRFINSNTFPKKTIQSAMDSVQPSVTQGSIPIPVQFLQFWIPGFTFVDTSARKIDDLVGMTILGEYEDEQIVQPLMELLGSAVSYGDYTNVPFSDWNVNYETRTVVRFEEGMQVGQLEAMQAARARIDSASMKREAAALQLEINRNLVGFYGFNNGANQTYGFLNDPGLPAYVTVANGASGSPLWANKTFLEIQNDILTGVTQLRTQSQDLIDPTKDRLVLAVATDAVDQLEKTSNFGTQASPATWIRETYPNMRVVSAPQLNNANGGANVFYIYAETINDMSTDGGKVVDQWVPMKFKVVGVEQRAKSYVEDYSNALAGVVWKRPWGVVRYSGI